MKVMKKWIVSIGFVLFLFAFIPTVHADEGKLYQVGTDKLEIRNAPYQEADSIGQLVSGDNVTIFQEHSGWVQTFYKGEVAWVASHYLIPVDTVSKEITVPEKNNPEEKKAITRKGEIINLPKFNTVKPTKILLGTTEITAKETKTESDTLSGYHFVIDAGHGGKDAGAIGHQDVNEKDLTLSTAKEVANKLEDEGATVTQTRSDDSFISLDERVKISNNSQTAAFISIHYNAYNDPAAEGIGTFYSSGDQNQKLAQTIQASLADKVDLADRGAKQAKYHVLEKNSQSAVLLELGFITNPKELKNVQTAAYRKKVAKGIADGLKHFLNE